MGRSLATILIVISLISLGSVIPFSASADSGNTTQQITFSASDPTNTITLSSSVYVTYADHINIHEGESTTISYSIQPGDLTLTIWLKLSSLNLGLSDQTITVPIADTQLLNQTVSLTEYLSNVPSSLASVDMVIKTKVSMVEPTASSSYCSVYTSGQSMTWGQWGSKSFDIQANQDSIVRTQLYYQITIGVVADVLKFFTSSLSVTLIPDTVVTSSAGDNPLITSVQIINDQTSPFGDIGSAAIDIFVLLAVAVVVLLVFFYARSKANKKSATPSQPQNKQSEKQAKYCIHCGQPLNQSAFFCTRCGKKQ